jgi:hypothetical protein
MSSPRWEIRPLGLWTGPTTWERRSSSAFRAPWTSTLDLLLRETEMLGAGVVVALVDVTDAELRRDGMLRANARVDFPGVRVAFDSRHGPLTYATDAYDTWRANVRAIALALEALRAVDRYGVSKSGEQYRGWSAIAGGDSGTMSAAAAARLLAEEGGGTPAQVRTDPDARAQAYRRAVRKHHPDLGGDADRFRKLTEARDVLAASEANTSA